MLTKYGTAEKIKPVLVKPAGQVQKDEKVLAKTATTAIVKK